MTTVPITEATAAHDARSALVSEARGLIKRLNGRLHGTLRALSVRRRDGLAIRCHVLDGTVCVQLAPEE